ncbi:MAG: NUDIX domain-containing protein [Steroidobacter sp.]
MSTRKLQARVRARTLLHEGFLSVYRYEFEVERQRGGTTLLTWEMMERGHAVAVLGHDPVRDEIVLVNEFRPGVLVTGDYPYRDNLVAGAIDEGETAIEAGAREMQEEAGLTLHEPRLIHPGAFVSSGGTSEKIALVYGRVDTSGGAGIYGVATEREETLSVILPARVFIERVRKGEITDLKTLVAGYWFAERHADGDFNR